jgi:hypothetical protein
MSTMNRIKSLFFILVILSFGKDIYCQKIFRDGYIIKNTGEVLNGIVEYSIDHDIPAVCTFKRFDIARKVVYSPEKILAFGYKNGNRYESREVNNKSSFYEVIVTGKIILYHKRSKYYLDKDHLGIVELKNGPITYFSNGVKAEFKSLPEFLRFITEGKAGTISDRFNLKDEIVQLITSYNKESGKSYYVFNRSISEKQLIQEIRESGAYKNKIGIMSGVNLYMLNLKYGYYVYARDMNNYLPDPKTSISSIIGLSYERLIARKSDRLSIRLDLLYTKQTFYCHGERTSISGDISRDHTFFSFAGIKAPVLLQYSITGSRIVPYFNAGIAYQFFIDNNYHHTVETENISHEISTSEDNKYHFMAGEISAAGGAGIRTRLFKNIELNLAGRVEFGSGLFLNSDHSLENSNPSAYSLYQKNPFIQNSIQPTFLIGITF